MIRNKIKKLPYLGFSDSLIEYMCIIGFHEHQILNDMIPHFNCNNSETFKPSVISSIIGNNNLELPDTDIITHLVFPNDPTLSVSETKQQTVIFFFNADDYINRTKLPFHGLATIFYEKYNTVYVPKALCIISQFPYFTTFSNINKEILKLFVDNPPEIPIEILCYNIMNFIPSPLNYPITLNNIFSSNMANFTRDSLKTTISNTTYSKSYSKQFNMSNYYYISQLTGYPVLEFNMSMIFNYLPLNIFLEIFIFSVLEMKMLFFSQNLELLNYIMYVIAALNYPCTDSNYFWHIVSISVEDFNSDESIFNKPGSYMLGINTSYDRNKLPDTVSDSRIIVDIDNRTYFYQMKECFQNEADEQNEAQAQEKFQTLQNYIRKICQNYNVGNSYFLASFIKTILRELNVIANQTTVGEIYETSDRIKFINRNIQEVFYNFMINILTLFYNNYYLNTAFDTRKSFSSSDSNTKFSLEIREDTSKFGREELIFYEEFKDAFKYNSYILNFIQKNNCFDLYKLPLIFSEEFIFLKKNNEEKQWRFFDIIDEFYEFKKVNAINFENFFKYYQFGVNLKETIKETVLQNKRNVRIRVEGDSTKYKYSLVDFNKEILSEYIYYLNGLSESELNDLFPSRLLKEQNTIKKVHFTEINEVIEKSLISYNILKYDHVVIFSLILFFIMTRFSVNFNESISDLRDILELLDTKFMFTRKYITLMLEIYSDTNKTFLEEDDVNENEIPNLENLKLRRMSSVKKKIYYANKMCNFILLNFLRTKNILPNEPMMNIFEYLSDNIEDQVSTDDDIKINEEISNETENIINYDHIDFLKYNACKCIQPKKKEYFLKMADDLKYEGDLFVNCLDCGVRDNKTVIHFMFKEKEKKIITEIFSPIKLYKLTNTVFEQFKQKRWDFSKLNSLIIEKLIVNLVFYCKSLEMPYKFLLKFIYN